MKADNWFQRLVRWTDGNSKPLHEPQAHVEFPKKETPEAPEAPFEKGPSLLKSSAGEITNFFLMVVSMFCCGVLILVLLLTVAYLPRFGSSYNAPVNEVSQRYVEQGVQEVGATNLVTNIILVYRGFDTYGESCVLFLGATAVIMLMAIDRNNTTKKDLEELEETEKMESKNRNQIIRHVTMILMPIIFLYGLYILCNGHLSPGGGFAGGSILGGALILCETAFGVKKVHSFFNHKVYHIIKVGALILYAVLICYTIFVGANGLENIIPLGKPGSILSAGIILPINVAVGLEVACTMYAFYIYFGKGDL